MNDFLNTLNNNLTKKYGLDKVDGMEEVHHYSGRHQDTRLSYTCSGNLPFTKVLITVSFDHKSDKSLGIGSEQLFSDFIKWVGYKDVKTPDSKFNEYFKVKSNDPKAMTEFLTKDMRRLFNRLSVIGNCSWNYKPSKNQLFKRNTSRDNENVLDDSELTLEVSTRFNQRKENSLVVIGIINPEFERNEDKIQQFIQLLFEVTMHINTDFLNR